jgi:hypothetical protein
MQHKLKKNHNTRYQQNDRKNHEGEEEQTQESHLKRTNINHLLQHAILVKSTKELRMIWRESAV